MNPIPGDPITIETGKLSGTLLDGVWIHVGTPQARDEAEDYLRTHA